MNQLFCQLSHHKHSVCLSSETATRKGGKSSHNDVSTTACFNGHWQVQCGVFCGPNVHRSPQICCSGTCLNHERTWLFCGHFVLQDMVPHSFPVICCFYQCGTIAEMLDGNHLSFDAAMIRLNHMTSWCCFKTHWCVRHCAPRTFPRKTRPVFCWSGRIRPVDFNGKTGRSWTSRKTRLVFSCIFVAQILNTGKRKEKRQIDVDCWLVA